MREHHGESLRRMAEFFRDQDGVLGLVLGGSLARGRERPDSDIDAMVVVTPERHARHREANRLSECISGHCTYPEGYFDVKYMTVEYLRAAAERGNDPTRESFVGARVVFSRVDGLEEVVRRIPVYPTAKKRERIELFYSILCLCGDYFFDCAWREADNPYLLSRAASDAVYGGLRMLLARNEAFFPSHRRLAAAAAELPDAPAGIVPLANALVARPTPVARDAFVQAIRRHPGWEIDVEDYGRYLSLYVKHMEQFWLDSDANVFEL